MHATDAMMINDFHKHNYLYLNSSDQEPIDDELKLLMQGQ